MSTAQNLESAYGLTQALINVFPYPIYSNRNPTVNDKAQLGRPWINSLGNAAYVLTSIKANSSTWISIGGGSGSFTNLTVTGTSTFGGTMTLTGTAGINIAGTGIISVANGNIEAPNGTVSAAQVSTTAGMSAGTSFVAGTTITATDNLIAGGAVVAGTGVVTVNGAGATLGTNPGLSLTSTLNTTQSTGALTIKSTTATNESNNGLIQVWIGGGVGQAWIPYFTAIG